WRPYFSIDRLLSARAPAFTSTPPFAEIRAARDGWTALHPNRDASGVLHAYSSGVSGDEDARQSAAAASGAKLADVFIRSVNPGVRSNVWEGNCIAIGAAACILDPIHDVDLHALQL